MTDLMNWISNTDEIPNELREIHVKLLRKLKKSVVPEKFERAIVKLLYSIGSNDAYEVERYGYLHSDFRVKLRILKILLEMQFDVANSKLKNFINQKNSNELRLEPFGSDKFGNVYYCHMDEKANIKVYQENTDEETWTVVASTRDELANLIVELKGNKPIRPFPKDLIDEDSSSNSRLSAKEEVIIEQKPIEQPEYSIDNSSANDEFPLKQTIRLVKKGDVKEESPVEQPAEPDDEDEKSDKTPEKTTALKKRRRK